MDHVAIALQCCEKLSQQMKRIFEETEEKTAEQKKWMLRTEAKRLEANTLRFSPCSCLSLRICESQLNAQAYRVATREIQAVRQRYEENWMRQTDQKEILKQIDLEQNKLIRLEIELEQFRQSPKKDASAERTNRVPSLLQEFATKFSKLKNSVNKLEIMTSRCEGTLNDVIDDGSHAKTLLTELETRLKNRQEGKGKFNNQLREHIAALRVKNYLRQSETIGSRKGDTLEYYDDADEEILKERLIHEREANKQLEAILIYARNWLQQEENFKREVEMLNAVD